jgi:hypothetical protein
MSRAPPKHPRETAAITKHLKGIDIANLQSRNTIGDSDVEEMSWDLSV